MNKEQKEILSLLPDSIIKSKKFSEKAKLVLAHLIYYNDSEFAKTNGFFYKTNTELMNDSGLSNKGIGVVLNRFSDLGFISRNVGKYKGNASEYRLNLSAIQNFSKGELNGEVSIQKGELKGEVSKFTLTESQYNDLLLSIDVMKQKIRDLEGEVSRLKGEPFTKGEVSKFTTEPETDTEKETINNSNSSRTGNADEELSLNFSSSSKTRSENPEPEEDYSLNNEIMKMFKPKAPEPKYKAKHPMDDDDDLPF